LKSNEAGTGSLVGGNGADVLDGGTSNDTLLGGNGADSLYGNEGDDWLDGGADNDYLSGSSGNDTIDGGIGADGIRGYDDHDSIIGGAGNDTLEGGNGNDSITGGAGNDVMDGGEGDDIYFIEIAADHLRGEIRDTGTTGDDAVIFFATVASTLTIYADDTGIEDIWLMNADFDRTGTVALNIDARAYNDDLSIFGNNGPNSIVGGNVASMLYGAGGNDTIVGGTRSDYISSGLGNDVLTGNGGNDAFVFNVIPNASTNVDILIDFTISDGDYIMLNKTIFTAFSAYATGRILAGAFWSGANVTAAHDADDRIIYNTSTGALYYDADGTGAIAPIQFAIMGSTLKPALTYDDFHVY
jgi:Ca2+-binding RTX toxin-like protein